MNILTETDRVTGLMLNPWTGHPYAQQLDPELAVLMERQRAGRPGVDRYALPFPESRRLLEEERTRTHAHRISMHRVTEEQFLANGRAIRLRWYHAGATDSRRTPVIYFHGGGWCVGSNVTHDTVLRHLARATQAPVCGVDYSLAPEHPFPAALEDVRATVDFILQQPVSQQSHGQVILAGDSAGANLALVETMRRLNEGQAESILSLLLYYGVYGPCREGGSFAAYGDGRFGLSNRAQQRYLDAYMCGTQEHNWQVFPLMGEFRGLPPTYILAAELDPLFDDSIDLHRALQAHEVVSCLSIGDALPHGFLNQANELPAAARAIEQSAAFVQRVADSTSHP